MFSVAGWGITLNFRTFSDQTMVKKMDLKEVEQSERIGIQQLYLY